MNRKVLVVEDESIVAMELEEQLKRLGCHVIGPVSTATAALRLCEAAAPDLVLMDIRIQGPQDGIETAQLLRDRFDVAMIYLTALADEITLGRAKLTSPDSYLLKPLRDDELKAAVEIAFYKREMERVVERQRAEFLAMLTHDIRGPLHLISGYAELLGEELREASLTRASELLGRLQETLYHTAKFVADELTLLTVDPERRNLAKARFSPNETLQRVMTRYHPEASRHNLRLEGKLAEDLPAVEGDPSLFERIVGNLLLNALKFTPPRGHVTLSSELRGNDVVVSVADSGPGIPGDELPKIFDKGWRRLVDSEKEGSGLGLYIVKTLVQALGGRIEVESKLGGGSCFSVFLTIPSDGFPSISGAGGKEIK